jgi:NAD dependent epimerase/dehydratase
MAGTSAVLVTGAGGFIGSHLVEALVARGHRVRAFVRYNARADAGLLRLLPRDKSREVEIVFGDLRDADAVAGAVRGTDVVYHLGALIGIPYSYVHPRETVETNVLGTLNVLTAARGTECTVVHTSTSEVYGTALSVPIAESHPLQGQSPYSASKIGADMLAESFHLSFGVRVATVRPFNTYGPRQSARAVVMATAVQALTGDVVRLGDLAPTRDLNFVTDTVEGFLLAGATPAAIGQTINLASGTEISIGDLARKIIALVGRPVRLETDEARKRPERSEVMRLQGDNRRAQEVLGWRPQIGLDAGLRATVEWLRAHLASYDAALYQV